MCIGETLSGGLDVSALTSELVLCGYDNMIEVHVSETCLCVC